MYGARVIIQRASSAITCNVLRLTFTMKTTLRMYQKDVERKISQSVYIVK